MDAFGAFATTSYGGQGDDTVQQGSDAQGVLYGNKGNDWVHDQAGAGFENGADLNGAAQGSSVLYGGQGNDTVSALNEGGDTMYGGQGDNLFAVNDGLSPDDFTVNDLVTVGDFVSGNDSLAMSSNISGPLVKENDLFADNSGDALSFADGFYSSHSGSEYLFIYGGAGAGYLFYNGDPDHIGGAGPNDGMILVGDNAESSVSGNDIVVSIKTVP